MKAEPYDHDVPDEQIRKEFLSDLNAILDQNRSLSGYLHWKQCGENEYPSK